jgi:hypothetical protein
MWACLTDRDLEALRHQVLQLAVVFTCSISQLSPGAYFLRRDLFPCIAKVQITISLSFDSLQRMMLLVTGHHIPRYPTLYF